MTSTHLSSKLAALGVTYSPDNVRKAWTRGAPRNSAKAFAGWLAMNAKKNSAAASSAASAVGLSRGATGSLSIANSKQGAAIFLEIFRRAGFPFWAMGSPVLCMTMCAAIDEGEQKPTVADLLGKGFFEAAMNATLALKKLVALAPAAAKRLEEAGYDGDTTVWDAAYGAPDGLKTLNTMTCVAWDRFNEMTDEPKKRK